MPVTRKSLSFQNSAEASLRSQEIKNRSAQRKVKIVNAGFDASMGKTIKSRKKSMFE